MPTRVHRPVRPLDRVRLTSLTMSSRSGGEGPTRSRVCSGNRWKRRLLERAAAVTQREVLQRLLTTILALFTAALTVAQVDPELDSREEPFFDQNSRHMFREQLAEELGSDVPDPDCQDSNTREAAGWAVGITCENVPSVVADTIVAPFSFSAVVP